MKELITKMTLKRAKEICREDLGRMPRAGYEYIIKDGNHYRLTLVNTSGKLSLREWLSPSAAMYEIEHAAGLANQM